jgi:hypothetical protein
VNGSYEYNRRNSTKMQEKHVITLNVFSESYKTFKVLCAFPEATYRVYIMMKISVFFSEGGLYFAFRGEEAILFLICLEKQLGLTKIRPCQKKKVLYSNIFKFCVCEMKHEPR